jgi:cytochrome c553
MYAGQIVSDSVRALWQYLAHETSVIMKKMVKTSIVLATIVALGISLARAEEAKVLWEKNCASCHGKDGTGKTMMGKKAGCRDYTDDKVQASLDDAKAFKSIKEGISEDGKDRMRAFGSKLSDDEIKSLVAYVHTFKK